jgi:hypothetical protein
MIVLENIMHRHIQTTALKMGAKGLGTLVLCMFLMAPARYVAPWPDSGTDSDYVLDQQAFAYLPENSRARDAAGRYWCGTVMMQFLMKHGPIIEERDLLERAKLLQALYAPEEIDAGPLVSSESCHTPGCEGQVEIEFLGPALPVPVLRDD